MNIESEWREKALAAIILAVIGQWTDEDVDALAGMLPADLGPWLEWAFIEGEGADRPVLEALEAERALLGGVLLDSAQIEDVAKILQPRDFCRPEHGALFELLLDMQSRGASIDLITVGERVVRGGQQDRFGGVVYVSELPEQVPSTANLQHYAEAVRDRATLRKFYRAARDAQPVEAHEMLSLVADVAARCRLAAVATEIAEALASSKASVRKAHAMWRDAEHFALVKSERHTWTEAGWDARARFERWKDDAKRP